MPANRRRGEISATIDGREWRLCLTLGALAELETTFGVDDLGQLTEHFAGGRLGARDIIAIIGAGLRGAGALLSDEDVSAMSIEDGLAGFAKLTTELLTATFGGGAADPMEPRQTTRAGSPGTN